MANELEKLIAYKKPSYCDPTAFFTKLDPIRTVKKLKDNLSAEEIFDAMQMIDSKLLNKGMFNNLRTALGRSGRFKTTVIDIFTETDFEVDWEEQSDAGIAFNLSLFHITRIFDAYMLIKLYNNDFIKTKSFSFSSDLKEFRRKLFFILKSKCNRGIKEDNSLQCVKFAGDYIKLHFKSEYNAITWNGQSFKTCATLGMSQFLIDNNINGANCIFNQADNDIIFLFNFKEMFIFEEFFRGRDGFIYNIDSIEGALDRIANELSLYYQIINMVINASETLSSVPNEEFTKLKYLKHSVDFAFNPQTVVDLKDKIKTLSLYKLEKVSDPAKFIDFIENFDINFDKDLFDHNSTFFNSLYQFFRNNSRYSYSYHKSNVISSVLADVIKIINNGYDKNLLPGMIGEDEKYNVYDILKHKLNITRKSFPTAWTEEVQFVVVDGEKVKVTR